VHILPTGVESIGYLTIGNVVHRDFFVVSGNQTLEGHLLQWLMREDADYFGEEKTPGRYRCLDTRAGKLLLCQTTKGNGTSVTEF